MADHLATTTQQRYPGRASWRTFVQTAIGVILTLGVVLPLAVTIVGDELDQYLPPAWGAWLVAAAGFAAAVAKALAKIMAIPAVDAALQRVGLSSSPRV